jgi:hypothetical protein
VPVLRGPLQASGLSFGLGATLLAAPLAAPALSPSLVLPQLQPTPQVQVQASPALTPAASELDLTVPAAAPSAGASLEHLVAFADNLSRLASASAEPRPALDDFWSGPQSGGLGSPAVEAQGPSYLATPRDADFVRLGSIVAAAQASPSGRKILQSALALTRKQGRPIQVRFHGLKGNLGDTSSTSSTSTVPMPTAMRAWPPPPWSMSCSTSCSTPKESPRKPWRWSWKLTW